MELNEFLTIIKERRTEIVIITLGFIIAVLFFSALQKPVYHAKVILEYQGTSLADSFIGKSSIPNIYNQPERQLTTQAKLVTSKTLAADIIRKLNLKMSPEALLKKVSVVVEDKSDLIEIQIADNDPRKAKLIANTYAMEFLANAKRKSSIEVSRAKDEVSYKMRDVQEDINLYSQVMNSKSAEQQSGDDIKSQIAIATNIYTDLASKYQQLKILEDLSTGGIKLASPASLPERPSTPNIPRNLLVAIIIGLASGLIWVFSAEYLDNTIKSNEDIEKSFNLPAIGQIPAVKTILDKENKPIERGAGLVRPNSLEAEAFRSLRTNIQFLNFEDRIKTILITSPTSGDGKTTVSANLASTLAFSNRRVLLLDCDLRHPNLHKVFDLDNLVGLSSLLIDSNNLAETIQKTELPELSVITSGPVPPNPSELLGSGKMAKLIEVLEQRFDFIIIDTPPVCMVTDAAVMASKADGVLLISSFNATTFEAARDSRKILDKLQSRLLGVVVNKIDTGKGKYGYYRYSHYYDRYYHYYGNSESQDRLAG